jgi:hypothetical protein
VEPGDGVGAAAVYVALVIDNMNLFNQSSRKERCCDVVSAARVISTEFIGD